MTNSKKSTRIPVYIAVAAVCLGNHIGPGLSSGTMINAFFVRFGIFGIFLGIFAMALLSVAIYYSMEFSRLYKTYNYQSWSTKLYGQKWVVFLFDILFLAAVLVGMSGCISTVGTLLQNFFGLNYWIGAGFVVVIGSVLCAFGSSLIRRASSYMIFIILGVLALVIVLVLIFGEGDIAGSIAVQSTTLPSSNGFVGALWSAIVYASLQGNIVVNITAVSETLPDRKTSKKAAIATWIGNTSILLVMALILFSYSGNHAITQEPLPFYYILDSLGFDWLTFVYVLMVILAVLSSVMSFMFAGVARFGKYYRSKTEGANHAVRDGTFTFILLLACIAISGFGIMAIVRVGYTAMGYMYLPLVMLPVIFIGRKMISQKQLQKNNIESTNK